MKQTHRLLSGRNDISVHVPHTDGTPNQWYRSHSGTEVDPPPLDQPAGVLSEPDDWPSVLVTPDRVIGCGPVWVCPFPVPHCFGIDRAHVVVVENSISFVLPNQTACGPDSDVVHMCWELRIN